MEQISGDVALRVAGATNRPAEIPGAPNRAASLAVGGRFSAAAATLANMAFGAAIVLSPFRARFELVERSHPPVYGDYTDFLLFWSDIAVLTTLALWAAALVAARRRPRPGPFFVRWPALGVVVVIWLSAIASIDPALSVYTAIRATVLVALALFVLDQVRDPRRLMPAAAAMIVVQAVVAIGQVLDQHSLGWTWLGEHGLDPRLGVSVVTSAGGERLLRGYGLADHPNILGGTLAFGLLIVVAALPRAGDIARSLATVVVAIGALALVLTFSRGAVIAFAFAFAGSCGLLAVGRRWRDLRWWAVAAAAAALVLVVTIEPYGDFFAARSDPAGFADVATEQRSISERAALVDVANDLIVEHPFAGTGAGTIALAMLDAEPEFAYDYQPAHVVLLDVATEVGLFGALAYTVLVGAPFAAVIALRRRLDPPLIAATGLLAAVTVVGFFDYYTWTYAAGQFWFWLSIGLWAGAYSAARGAPATTHPVAAGPSPATTRTGAA